MLDCSEVQNYIYWKSISTPGTSLWLPYKLYLIEQETIILWSILCPLMVIVDAHFEDKWDNSRSLTSAILYKVKNCEVQVS